MPRSATVLPHHGYTVLLSHQEPWNSTKYIMVLRIKSSYHHHHESTSEERAVLQALLRQRVVSLVLVT
jgi:hypothetical protein